MPRFGTLDVTTILGDAPHVLSLEAPRWEMPEASFIQVNWEVDDAAALAVTPSSLHPSIPPYVAVFAGRFPDSPVGPFSLVQMRLVARAGIRPRGWSLGAVCDSAEATERLREHWGFPVVHGEVSFSARHDRWLAAAAVGGRTVVEVGLADPDYIAGSDLMAFDNLHLIRLGEKEEPALVQIDPEYAIHSAERGRPVLHLPDPEALGMRGGIRLTAGVTGFGFRADTDLVPVRFAIDPSKPAISGTRRVQEPAPA